MTAAPSRRSLRLAAALAAGGVSTAYAITWLPFAIDAATEVASPAGWTLLVGGAALLYAVVARAVYRAPTRRAALEQGLMWGSGAVAAGPPVLYVMRVAGIARTGAGLLADWEEYNALLVPMILGTLSIFGVVVFLVGLGLAMASRRRAAGAG